MIDGNFAFNLHLSQNLICACVNEGKQLVLNERLDKVLEDSLDKLLRQFLVLGSCVLYRQIFVLLFRLVRLPLLFGFFLLIIEFASLQELNDAD